LYRGVLLYSETGNGKSSLMNAGVIPCLAEDGFQAERIRVQPKSGEEIVVQLSEKVSGETISYRSIFASAKNLDRVVLPVEGFVARLRQLPEDTRPLLVFDQFEEWVTLFEETVGQAGRAARDSQDAIRDTICSLINDNTLPVKVLLVLREDFLARLTPFFRRCPNLPDQYLRLVALRGDQIYQAIRGPFDRYPGRFRPEISPDLAREIQRQFESRSAGSDIRLTEVQIVCRGLFESGKEPSKFLTDQGGVQGILERYLEESIESLDAEQRGPAVALLSRMVTTAGTRVVIPQGDLCWRVESEEGIQRPVLDETLDSLEQKAKLVRRERRRDVYYYEIASEFLVGWIRTKAQERQRHIDQKRLETQLLAEQERRRAQENAKQARIFRRLVWALCVLLVIAVGAILFAFYQRSLAQARQLVAISVLNESSDPELSVLFAANAVGATWPWGHKVLPQAESELHQAIMASHLRVTLNGRSGPVLNLAWNPDRKRLAIGSRDGPATVWDAESGKQLLALPGQGDKIGSVSWSPDGKRVASGNAESGVDVWDAESGAKLLVLPGDGNSRPVFSVDWRPPDGKRIAVANGDTVKVCDVESGRQVWALRGHTDDVGTVSWSPDGRRLATASSDKTAKVWDAENGKQLLALAGHTSKLGSVSWSPDGRRLATASWDETVKEWDGKTGEELLTLRGHSGPVYAVRWSPDGQRLATGSYDNSAKVWNARSGQELLTLRGHDGSVTSVSWNPDSNQLATGSYDNTVKIWDAESGSEVSTLRDHTGSVYAVAWHSDSRRLATASLDGTTKLWDVKNGQQLRTLLGHQGSVYDVCWSPDGKRLATANADQKAIIWDAENGQDLRILRGHSGPVTATSWSPDGKRIATASTDRTAIIWNASSGERLLTLQGHAGSVYAVSWSPDGKRLTTASEDQTAIIWDALSGRAIMPLTGHRGEVTSVAWSRDGKRLATGSTDQTIKLWDARSGKQERTLVGHGSPVTGVFWNADGRRLVTGSADQTAKVWDTQTGKELVNLTGHRAAIRGLAWSPDGKWLATSGDDDIVQIYSMDIRELMRIARQRITGTPSDQGCGKYLEEPKCPPIPTLSPW
jgi:WD40 repeat protein